MAPVAILLLLLFLPMTAQSADQIRIAFGSCADDDKPEHPIWDAIVASDPDAFLLIGDNVYADTPELKANPSAALLRAEYAKLAASPGFQRVRGHCPVYATWDDHDFGLNDGGAEWLFRDTAAEVFFEFFDPESPARHRQGSGMCRSSCSTRAIFDRRSLPAKGRRPARSGTTWGATILTRQY